MNPEPRNNENRSAPLALFINPWITDFAAYDLWARPLGLLQLAALFREAGWRVALVDCMDRNHPGLDERAGRDDGWGRGKYRAEIIETPPCLRFVNRPFRRYGIPLDAFDRQVAQTGEPDLVLSATRMTYWYPGARLAIERTRRLFPAAPVALGGVYASLCGEHARRHCGADYVIPGEGERPAMELAAEIGKGHRTPEIDLDDFDNLDHAPPPAWDLTGYGAAPAVLTSRGCPMRCSYCASSALYSHYRRRDPEKALEEILELAKRGARDIAFYDDALLHDHERYFSILLDGLIAAGAPVRLHTPNGVHSRFIDGALAEKTRAARMETLRLGLETADAARLKSLNRSSSTDDFLAAMSALRAAGFARSQLGVYLLAALPGQDEAEVRDSVDLVIEAGGTPLIGEFSPIPGTPEFRHAADACDASLSDEPLLQNNSVFHLLAPWSRDGAIARLRRYARARLGAVRP